MPGPLLRLAALFVLTITRAGVLVGSRASVAVAARGMGEVGDEVGVVVGASMAKDGVSVAGSASGVLFGIKMMRRIKNAPMIARMATNNRKSPLRDLCIGGIPCGRKLANEKRAQFAPLTF